MLIDETFWLELDRRLKPMFKAVNDKIGQVCDRLDAVSDRLDAVNANVTTLNNWTKRQDNCASKEKSLRRCSRTWSAKRCDS
jgi:hypothetical protein